MAAYEVRDFDLATARTKEPITSRAKLVASVAVTSIPAGAVAFLSFGDDKPNVALAPNRTFTLCPPENAGVYLSNPAAVGTCQLVISYEEAGSEGLSVSQL